MRVDVKEWLIWARAADIISDIIAFITFMPEALLRDVPLEPVPFSTPRAWASLSDAWRLAEQAGIGGAEQRRALAFGRVSAVDAAVFCAMAEAELGILHPPLSYFEHPEHIPSDDASRWFVLSAIRSLVGRRDALPVDADMVNRLLMSLPAEHRFALLVGMVERWGELGAAPAMFAALKEATGL